MPRGGQAGVLREAARDDPGGVRPHHRRRGRRRAGGWCRSGSCAATTRQYRAMKAVVTGGEIGAPLMMHAAHRNPSVPDFYTSDMIIVDSTVHDIDVARFMFDEEVAAVTVLKPRVSSKAKAGFNDPLLRAAGDDLRRARRRRGLGERRVRLRHPRRGRRARTARSSCRSRRAPSSSGPGRTAAGCRRTGANGSCCAFDAEFQAWIDAVAAGGTTGPSAWDGYAATVTVRHRPAPHCARGRASR